VRDTAKPVVRDSWSAAFQRAGRSEVANWRIA
jgi:hypothetical protein